MVDIRVFEGGSGCAEVGKEVAVVRGADTTA